jgi:MFS family permease
VASARTEAVAENLEGAPANASIKKIAAISMLVTSIEWYDFFLYATAAALVFPKIFFAADLPPLVSLLAAFGTFAVGFIARPLGAAIFGHFGDRHGRKQALVAALVLMGVATTLIGCLPTYALLGPLAPALLVLLRILQGLAVGGQWGGAALLITETAPPDRRGRYGSFVQMGAPGGVILSNIAFLIVSAALPQDDFISWGWRLPFLTSFILLIFALYIHFRLEDTEAFRELQRLEARRDSATSTAPAPTEAPSSSPVLIALRKYPREIALAAGAFIAINLSFYIIITFSIAYGTTAAGLNIPRETMLTAVLIGSAVTIPALYLSAAFSDRFGRRGIYMAGALLFAVWGFAFFPLIDTKSFGLIVLAIVVADILLAMMYGPQAALLTEMFSTEVRYSAASLGYQFGAIVGGALAPFIATALLAEFGTSVAVSIYIAAACGITALSVSLLKETRGASLSHGGQP